MSEETAAILVFGLVCAAVVLGLAIIVRKHQ